MPTLISETDVKLERADLLRRCVLPRQVSDDGLIVPPTRTPGLHQSGLFRYIAEKSRITSYMEQVNEEEMPLRWMLGQAFEEFAASLYPEMLWQPCELNDPVIMNCDGISFEENEIIEEFKFRRAKRFRSGEEMLKKNWLWTMQAAVYCIGYSCEFVRWHVLSAFEFPDPTYVKYLVQFSAPELAEVAHMIKINKQKAIEEGYAEA